MNGQNRVGPASGKLYVLLYDAEDVVAGYAAEFRKIFARAGYDAEITAMACGEDRAEHDDVAIFNTTYFDVFICDVSLGNKMGNQLGLRVLTIVKDSHPDIFTVAFTSLPVTYQRVSNRHRFDLYVDKKLVDTPKYQAFIATQLEQLICINPHAVVKSRRDEFWPGMSDEEWIDLQRIVRCVTYTGSSEHEQAFISNVRLRRIDGGFSGALVFSVQARTGSGQVCVQAVLKVARTSEPDVADSVRREVTNYRRLVRWHLPYHWRPELLGAASSGRLEALCYAFVSTREEPFETLRTFVRVGRVDVVAHAIESIYHPSRRRWYDERNVKKEDRLTAFYLDHCFVEGGSERELESFRKTLKDFDLSAADRVRVRDLEVRLPNLALFGKPAGSYLSCLIHGDMSTSNVFVSPSGNGSDIMLIDFASTRRGHVFFDFIVFEVNLRLDCRVRGSLSIHDRILQERALNAGRPSEVPCAQEISRLRQCAAENFVDERRDSYLYGMAAFCFSLMASSNLSEVDRQILASCTCAALMDLQERHFWEAQSLPPPPPPPKPPKGAKRRQNASTDE